jgi:hypothetical protein
MENFEFELYFKITHFKMTLNQKGKLDPIEAESTSNQMSGSMKDAIGRSRPGDKLYFEYIDAVGPDGKTRRLDPLNVIIQ